MVFILCLYAHPPLEYFRVRGYGRDAIPSFFIPYRWLRGYGRMPYPPMLVAWCEAQGVCV